MRPRRLATLTVVLALTTSLASVALAADEEEQPDPRARIEAALDRLRAATDELLAAHSDLTRLPGAAGRHELEARIARLKLERRALEREIASAQADRRAEVAAALGDELTRDRAALLDRVRRARVLAPGLLGQQARAALESVWLDLESQEAGDGPDPDATQRRAELDRLRARAEPALLELVRRLDDVLNDASAVMAEADSLRSARDVNLREVGERLTGEWTALRFVRAEDVTLDMYERVIGMVREVKPYLYRQRAVNARKQVTDLQARIEEGLYRTGQLELLARQDDPADEDTAALTGLRRRLAPLALDNDALFDGDRLEELATLSQEVAFYTGRVSRRVEREWRFLLALADRGVLAGRYSGDAKLKADARHLGERAKRLHRYMSPHGKADGLTTLLAVVRDASELHQRKQQRWRDRLQAARARIVQARAGAWKLGSSELAADAVRAGALVRALRQIEPAEGVVDQAHATELRALDEEAARLTARLAWVRQVAELEDEAGEAMGEVRYFFADEDRVRASYLALIEADLAELARQRTVRPSPDGTAVLDRIGWRLDESVRMIQAELDREWSAGLARLRNVVAWNRGVHPELAARLRDYSDRTVADRRLERLAAFRADVVAFGNEPGADAAGPPPVEVPDPTAQPRPQARAQLRPAIPMGRAPRPAPEPLTEARAGLLTIRMDTVERRLARLARNAGDYFGDDPLVATAHEAGVAQLGEQLAALRERPLDETTEAEVDTLLARANWFDREVSAALNQEWEAGVATLAERGRTDPAFARPYARRAKQQQARVRYRELAGLRAEVAGQLGPDDTDPDAPAPVIPPPPPPPPAPAPLGNPRRGDTTGDGEALAPGVTLGAVTVEQPDRVTGDADAGLHKLLGDAVEATPSTVGVPVPVGPALVTSEFELCPGC